LDNEREELNERKHEIHGTPKVGIFLDLVAVRVGNGLGQSHNLLGKED
jgi:hypothetical protein